MLHSFRFHILIAKKERIFRVTIFQFNLFFSIISLSLSFSHIARKGFFAFLFKFLEFRRYARNKRIVDYKYIDSLNVKNHLNKNKTLDRRNFIVPSKPPSSAACVKETIYQGLESGIIVCSFDSILVNMRSMGLRPDKLLVANAPKPKTTERN